MKSKKLGSVFLSLLLVFTLLIVVGCGTDDEKKPEVTNSPKPTEKPVDNGNGNKSNNSKTDNSSDTASDNKTDGSKENTDNNSSTTKTVKLLKRNGVEWKENTKINSKRGAKSYKVVWGDTLRLIAKTWRVNTRKLARYNNIKNADLIEVGQVIYNYAYKK